MTTGSGGKPPSGSQPGRAAADTPNKLVVRAADSGAGDSMLGATDTAVAIDSARSLEPTAAGPTPSAGTPAIVTTELVGATLSGKFEIKRKVGQGGMGAVYEATHTQLGKRVAVKVLLEKYAQREAIVKRLKQEAQLASSVGNEHIIDITDIGTTEDGRTYVVMEFLEGESLAECLGRETKLPEQRILKVISQAASALAAAHAQGVEAAAGPQQRPGGHVDSRQCRAVRASTLPGPALPGIEVQRLHITGDRQAGRAGGRRFTPQTDFPGGPGLGQHDPRCSKRSERSGKPRRAARLLDDFDA